MDETPKESGIYWLREFVVWKEETIVSVVELVVWDGDFTVSYIGSEQISCPSDITNPEWAGPLNWPEHAEG